MADSITVMVDSPPKPEFPHEKAHRQRKSNNQDHIATHKPQHSPSIIQKAIAEFVGTYILIFVGCGAALVNETLPLTIVGIAMVGGLALTVAFYSVGHVSGGHFNPAVTIALATVRKIQLKLVPIYVLCQLMSATLAIFTLKVLYHDKVDIAVTVTQFTSSTSHLEALVWEFIITSILVLTICGVATDHRGSKNFAGAAIGISVIINIIIAGPITGASMNPARSLGPAIISGVYKNIWVYLISPTLGAIFATVLYKFLRVSKPAIPEDHTLNYVEKQAILALHL